MRNPASPDEVFLFSSLPFSLAPCSGCQPLRGAPLRCAPSGDDALRVVLVCGYRDGEHRAALRAGVRSGLRPESNREHDKKMVRVTRFELALERLATVCLCRLGYT